jgi:hypothetical protein
MGAVTWSMGIAIPYGWETYCNIIKPSVIDDDFCLFLPVKKTTYVDIHNLFGGAPSVQIKQLGE